jgi:exopolysaccharide biosynthesis polyprenyl glycosylphosphotransferase
MNAPLSAKLQIHEDELDVEAEPRGQLVALPAVDDRSPRRHNKPVVDEPTVSSPPQREILQRRLLAAADVLAVALTVVLALNVNGLRRVALVAVALPLVIVPFKVAGLYDRDELRLGRSTLDEAPALMQLTALFALGVTILKLLLQHGTLQGDRIAGLWLGALVATFIGRSLARWVAGRISPLERCLVIGEFERAQRVRERLAASTARATVVASLPLDQQDIDDLDGLVGMRQLVQVLEVDRIVIAPSASDSVDTVGVIRVAKAVGVPVSVLPRMLEAVGSAVEFDDIDGMPMLGVRRFGLSKSSRLLKRAFDLVAASLGLIVIAPLLGLIAAAIRLDSRGPVFFQQTRVGRDGRHFAIFKFRSMVADAESMKHRLHDLNEAGLGLFKIAADPRITRVGKLLRASSLDELPQLFNVIRGEMSLVGPRPLVLDEDAQVVGLDRSRLHLTPGMTGPWQVLGMRVPMQEMVGIDYLYVANWSLWLDLKILLRTVRKVARRSNL